MKTTTTDRKVSSVFDPNDVSGWVDGIWYSISTEFTKLSSKGTSISYLMVILKKIKQAKIFILHEKNDP